MEKGGGEGEGWRPSPQGSPPEVSQRGGSRTHELPPGSLFLGAAVTGCPVCRQE